MTSTTQADDPAETAPKLVLDVCHNFTRGGGPGARKWRVVKVDDVLRHEYCEKDLLGNDSWRELGPEYAKWLVEDIVRYEIQRRMIPFARMGRVAFPLILDVGDGMKVAIHTRKREGRRTWDLPTVLAFEDTPIPGITDVFDGQDYPRVLEALTRAVIKIHAGDFPVLEKTVSSDTSAT